MEKALIYGRKAARIGFDWGCPAEILPKVREELDEVASELESGGEALEEELGDLLFVVVNLVRLCGSDPGRALHRANRKFARRLGHMEVAVAAAGQNLADLTLDEQEELWGRAKEHVG